jgi:hypothetical protein
VGERPVGERPVGAARADAAEAGAGGAADDLLAALLGLAGVGLLAASPWLVDRSGPEPFYKGPLIFPLIALALLVAGALPSILRLGTALLGGSGGLPRFAPPWPAVRLIVLMSLFPPALPVIGLEAAVAVFASAGLLSVGWRRPVVGLAVALSLALILHLAFKVVLDVWFPEPLLWALLEGAG